MTTTVPMSEASDAGAVRGAIRDTSTALRQVFAHSALRRMQLAVSVIVPVALLLPATRRLDQRLRRPAGLALLQALPIFAPLGPARLESLARHLDRLEVPAGTVIIGERDRGDLFYVIDSGRVSVSRAGSHIRDEGAGDYFGEIALLRDLPRTATVTAVENTALSTLARHDFLDAVAGNGDVMGALHEVVAHRMRF